MFFFLLLLKFCTFVVLKMYNKKSSMIKYQIRENAYFGEDDRYWIVRLLERYKHAEVWLADDLQTGLLVAIKVYTNRTENEGIQYETFENMPCLLMPNISAVWTPDTDYLVEFDMLEKPNRPPEKRSKKYFFVSVVLTLIVGLCAGFVFGLAGSKNNPMLHESISLIEKADAIFSELDKTTWMESLAGYKKANELTNRYDLQLPDLQPRITQLQERIETEINSGIEASKKFYEDGFIEAAIYSLDSQVLIIDPENSEAIELRNIWVNAASFEVQQQ